MLHRSISGILFVLMSLSSEAIRADESFEDVHVGLGTKQWLELQRSGFAASQNRQTVSGPVASAIYQRYVDSFKHPIPDLYQSQRRSTGSGGRSN